MKQKLMTGLFGLAVAVLVTFFLTPDYRQGEPSIRGQTPKDFAFTIAGKPMHLSDLRGHIVVLNFWASWCPPCIEEAPSLNALQSQLAPMGGMVLGIDPNINEDQSSYEKFLSDYHIAFPTYLDPTRQIAASYGTTMYPETYVIDPDGKFDRKIIGPQNWSSPEMVAYFDTLGGAKAAGSLQSSLLP